MAVEAPAPAPHPRYSPSPLEAYVSQYGHGPGADSRVSHPAIWNLAYLSADFDTHHLMADVKFLTLIRRTCQVDWRDGSLQVAKFLEGDHTYLLAGQLRKPAPQFVHWLTRRASLIKTLPAFKAYGLGWVAEMRRRERICQTYEHLYEKEPPVLHVQDAERALEIVLKR